MSVLDRAALQDSPLADLHALASELSIDGYRRLRREELIDSILARQAGEEPPAGDRGDAEDEPVAATASDASEDDADSEDTPAASRRRRGRRGGRGRATGRASEGDSGSENSEAEGESERSAGRESSASSESSPETPEPEDEVVEGVVELLANGSGFVRVNPPEQSDGDVYISAAQVRRCELVSGDHVSGPRRPPRRSERYASLIRVETINYRPATELADSTRFDDLPATFPTETFRLGSDDETIKAIESVAPFGKGSRVTIVGGYGSGKTEMLRRLTVALSGQDGLQLSLALAGVRPEEIAEWSAGEPAPTAAVSIAGSSDAQSHAVELVVDQGRRIAARGADAIVIVDSLDGLSPNAARRALASARNIVDGGSLTVIATASSPVGGETTVITLDRALAREGRFPAIDPAASGTIRAELLAGE